MHLIHSSGELKPAGRKVCLAIGFFDGVHLGHQQIVRQTVSDARQHEAISLVITFDCHPNTIVAPDHVPPLIYSLPQKVRTIESLGADALLLLHFDREFSLQTGEAFIRRLVSDFGEVQSICVGATFAFGHKRSGNVALLRKLSEELGFNVHGMAAVSLDDKPVSSTRIRQAIARGDLDAASQMLGRAYSLTGQVVPGDRLGHQLGFPTANIDAGGLALPPDGVYAAHAKVVGERSARRSDYRAVVNIGVRPSVSQPTPQRRVEAHLLAFQSQLYSHELELVFVEKLRDEEKFPSLDELRQQIARDIDRAQQLFQP
jgi:riboflavin kinase/FMN adenylyltransferase